MTTEGFVGLQPDGAGKAVDASIVTGAWGGSAYRQNVVIADPSSAASVAGVTPDGALRVRLDEILSAQTNDAPLFVVLSGDASGDFAGVNMLEEAAKDGSGFGFNVKIINPPKMDASGAAIISDAVPVPIPPQPIGATIIIDTTGYASLGVTSQTLAGNVASTNDLKTLSALSGTPAILGALTSTIAASTSYSFPTHLGRYIVITVTTAGTATLFLRAAPWNGSYTTSVPTGTTSNNIAQIGGSAVVSAGVAGMPAIGGNIAPGAAATANPVPIGGVDASGLTRRFLTDASGRQQQAVLGVDASATQRQIGVVTPAGQAVPSLAVIDQNAVEGSTRDETLVQILRELQIANLYLHQLGTAGNLAAADDPAALRNDPSTSFN